MSLQERENLKSFAVISKYVTPTIKNQVDFSFESKGVYFYIDPKLPTFEKNFLYYFLTSSAAYLLNYLINFIF